MAKTYVLEMIKKNRKSYVKRKYVSCYSLFYSRTYIRPLRLTFSPNLAMKFRTVALAIEEREHHAEMFQSRLIIKEVTMFCSEKKGIYYEVVGGEKKKIRSKLKKTSRWEMLDV